MLQPSGKVLPFPSDSDQGPLFWHARLVPPTSILGAYIPADSSLLALHTVSAVTFCAFD